MSSTKKPCKVGHLWGKWEQDPVACVGRRVCERCGQQEEREMHVWDKWVYHAPGSCIQVRVCKRCGQTRNFATRTRHVWAPWAYDAAGACRQSHVCSRCGKTESQTIHAFGAWRYPHPGHCQEARLCARCGQEESRVRHKWGKWEYEAPHACRQLRVCGRCRKAERRLRHTWGQKDDKTGRSSCDRCGELDIYEARPCPKCGAHRLVYDGMLVWRSGPRPPRKLARKKVRFSRRADVEREHCYHCEACGAEFFQDVETGRSRL